MEIQPSATSTRLFCVNTCYEALLHHNGINSAEALYELQSETVKKVLKERGTSRAFLKDPEEGPDIECYIKRYLKPSLKDRFKCALSFKPVFSDGALHEWDALCAFHRNGLNTMEPVAAGTIGSKTCNLTLGITAYIRASALFREELQNDPERRNRLVKKIADYAARMHNAGLTHQDFYLVHLFIKPQEEDAVYLIDLQRVLIQKRPAWRWVVKDLAQIRFALKPFITEEEAELFREIYVSIRPLPRRIWRAVETKSERIHQHSKKRKL